MSSETCFCGAKAEGSWVGRDGRCVTHNHQDYPVRPPADEEARRKLHAFLAQDPAVVKHAHKLSAPSQNNYFALRERLPKDEDDSDRPAEQFLAQQLRTLANHLETGDYPRVFGFSQALLNPIDPKQINGGEVIEDFLLILSHPWGG